VAIRKTAGGTPAPRNACVRCQLDGLRFTGWDCGEKNRVSLPKK
jgi:hypothetical protein